MNEIAQDTPSYKLRACLGAPSSRGRAAADLGIEPRRFLASLLTPASSVVCMDMNRGVVSFSRERSLRSEHRLGLADVAREAQITLTRAIALRAHQATASEDIAAAQHLVRRRYSWRGYEVPISSTPVAVPAPAGHIVFVAKDSDQTVGTVTLGLDCEAGLLAESTYPEIVRERRQAGCSVCEVTRLAVAERADSKPVLAALFSLAFATASANGVTDVFVEVNPRHVIFYRRVLGFAIAAGERLCERVKAPSVLLWLTMEELEKRLTKLNAKVEELRYRADARAA